MRELRLAGAVVKLGMAAWPRSGRYRPTCETRWAAAGAGCAARWVGWLAEVLWLSRWLAGSLARWQAR